MLVHTQQLQGGPEQETLKFILLTAALTPLMLVMEVPCIYCIAFISVSLLMAEVLELDDL